jgi:hypothetical protein
MPQIRHGTAGFTSPPKEGVLGFFSPRKIRRLRPGLNQRTWVLEANTHPLDHRSCYVKYVSFTYKFNSANWLKFRARTLNVVNTVVEGADLRRRIRGQLYSNLQPQKKEPTIHVHTVHYLFM